MWWFEYFNSYTKEEREVSILATKMQWLHSHAQQHQFEKEKKAFTGADCFFNPILTYSHWNNLLNWFCTCSNKHYYTYTNNLYHLFNYDWPCPHSSQSFASQMFFVFWSGAFRMYFLSSVSMAKTCSFVPTLAFGRMPTNFERSMVWRFSFLLASL